MKYIFLPVAAFFMSLSSFSQTGLNTTETKEIEAYMETAVDTVKNKKGQILKEVVVSSNKDKKTISALRSGLKPMDTPQSLQVIGSEIIGQQQSIRLSDVIKNANGIYVGSARGGAQESFFSRGYDMSGNNMFKNGFRYNGGSIPEVSGLEKVEFLKGGSALLYGNVAPGGILNLVTKTPKFTAGGELSMQMGSFSYYKPSIDFYGPLSKTIAYRVNASYEKSESFRDFVKNDRIYINPSLLIHVTDKTQITVQGDYLSADWTPDFGTGIVGKEILDLPRNQFFGAKWSNGNTKSSSASVQLHHDFNINWNLNFNSSFQNYDRSQKSTAQLSNLNTYSVPGTWNRGLVQNKNLEKIFGDQLSIQGTFYSGKVKHQIFTGVDYELSIADNYTYVFNEKAVMVNGKYDPSLYDTINLFSFIPNSQRNDIPNAANTQIAITETSRFGGFAQDLISITDKIKVLAGIRWSWQEAQVVTTDFTKNTVTEGAKNLNKAFSPKAGLVYQPNKTTTVFSSYSNSFTPNTGTTVDYKPLDPSIIDQYEVGIKKDFMKGLFTTNITAYIIENNNLAQTAPFAADGVTPNVNTNLRELVGGTKGKGIEIDINANPVKGLNVLAGYSFNETKITKTSGTSGSLIEGDLLTRTPKHTANFSVFYKIPEGFFKGITLGGIASYVGDRVGGWNDRYVWTENKPSTTPKTYTITIEDRDIPLKGYTTVDASLGYEWNKISLLCKLSNITNELNYTVHENYSTNPIAPRQVMAILKYKL
ncbi:Metal-pseudopaline receptor CntO [Flavobacterium sp. CECT 9288]|uniref:TonB-dependent siderophore receptor n=1 Tax=Flavobacterium sp. CECT 9288 TaxID=2845819 RepID=UPI001E36D6D1|nr:TonB-dependent siderophore receptor [Flavobacterium sp. CECT 9288]CAH0335133.1 Metal-pseudopaline receptor CntO [Flavobacterium sp. CECT 9288]